MTLKGMFDTVVIKTKVHTSDGRGGVTTALAVKIASLTCAFQAIRREELRMDQPGQIVTDPVGLIYDTITSGPKVAAGDVVIHGDEQFLVITVTETLGKGAHTEAILKKVDGNALIA